MDANFQWRTCSYSNRYLIQVWECHFITLSSFLLLHNCIWMIQPIKKKKKKYLTHRQTVKNQTSLCMRVRAVSLFAYIIHEPTHKIMALIALRKLNLQTRMRSHPMGLHVWYLVRSFVYVYTLNVRTAKSLARLRGSRLSFRCSPMR